MQYILQEVVYSTALALLLQYLLAVALPDLQVVLWHNDGATPGDICAGVLAVAMRVISLPQILVGCTLSKRTESFSFSLFRLYLTQSVFSGGGGQPVCTQSEGVIMWIRAENIVTGHVPAEQHRPHPAAHAEGPLQVIDGLRKQLILRTHTNSQDAPFNITVAG